jgi:hypothetical protein
MLTSTARQGKNGRASKQKDREPHLQSTYTRLRRDEVRLGIERNACRGRDATGSGREGVMNDA